MAMKNKLSMMVLMLVISTVFSQEAVKTTKWRISEVDSLTVAQTMFDDQNFVLALSIFGKLQEDHPEVLYLKYVTGICCLFKCDSYERSQTLLTEVYSKNKKAEDIEYYLARSYHYNNKYEDALILLDKYLNKKKLTGPQKRNALILVDYCHKGKTLVARNDEGKLEDYIWVNKEDDEK